MQIKQCEKHHNRDITCDVCNTNFFFNEKMQHLESFLENIKRENDCEKELLNAISLYDAKQIDYHELTKIINSFTITKN